MLGDLSRCATNARSCPRTVLEEVLRQHLV